MKKIITLILLFSMLISITGCVFSGISDETKPLSTGDQTDPSGSGASEPKETKASASSDPTIEETVLYDKDGIKVTATKIVSDMLGWSLRVLTENNTEKDISIGTDYTIVNNYMMDDFFAETIPAGKKSTDDLTILSSFLEEAGITKIGHIEVSFHIFEDSTLNKLCTFTADLKTSLYDVMDSGTADGVQLYDANGVKIIGKYSVDTILGPQVKFYVENNNDYNITLSGDDLSVNGFAVLSLFVESINAHKKSISTLTIMKADLEKNGIETVESIEMKIKAYNPDTLDTYFVTDILKIAV